MDNIFLISSNNIPKKAITYLNFAIKSGTVRFGYNAILGTKPRDLKVVLLTENISDNSKNKILKHCKNYKIQIYLIQPDFRLLINNTGTKVIGILKSELGKKIDELLKSTKQVI